MEEPTQEVEETTLTTPSQEQTESEEVTTEESEAASDEVVEETTEVKSEEEPVKKRSNRLERRFAKMSQKHREQEEEIRRLSALQQPTVESSPQIPLDQEITLDQYGQDVARQAKTIASAEIQQLRMEQALKERADNFERDVEAIERKYDVLNEDSPNHDSVLSSKVAGMYERLSKDNPNIRLKDIVEDIMEIADRQSASSNASVSASVAQAAAETSIKPDTTANKESKKSFEELSLREMEEQLGFNK